MQWMSHTHTHTLANVSNILTISPLFKILPYHPYGSSASLRLVSFVSYRFSNKAPFSCPPGCLYLYAVDVPTGPLNLPARTPLSDTNYAVANGVPRANWEIEVGFIWWKQPLGKNLAWKSERKWAVQKYIYIWLGHGCFNTQREHSFI